MALRFARFFFLAAGLAALCGCAAPRGGTGAGGAASAAGPEAGWLLLGRTEGASLYIHPRSTLRVGSSAFIMVVAANHRPAVLPDGATVGSLRERYEIDCEGRRYRRHDGTAHPDNAALGPVLGRVGQDQWKGITPETVMAAVSSAVCGAAAPDAPDDFRGPAWRSRRVEPGTYRT